MPNLELFVPLRPNRAAPRRPKTALCTNGVYDFQGLEQLIPGHVEFWFRYHSDYLGIDEIYIYDLDGSFKDLSIIRELQERGKLFYERFIPSIPPLQDVFDQAGYKVSTTHFTQTSVHQHCWQRARQNADWALSLAPKVSFFFFSKNCPADVGWIIHMKLHEHHNDVEFLLIFSNFSWLTSCLF